MKFNRIYYSIRVSLVIALLFVLLSVGLMPAVGQQAGCTQFKVPTTGWTGESWFDTGINVPSGQTISVTATGSVSPDTRKDIRAGPGGTFAIDIWQTDCSFRSDWGHEALIARIGAAGSPIFIGTGTTFSAPSGGELWLGVNDKYTSDNAGGFVAEVCLSQPQPGGEQRPAGSYILINPINPRTDLGLGEAEVYTTLYPGGYEDARDFRVIVVGEGGFNQVPDGTPVTFSLTDPAGDTADAWIEPDYAETENSEVYITYHPPSDIYWQMTEDGGWLVHDPSSPTGVNRMVITATSEGVEGTYILYMVRPMGTYYQ